MAKQPAIVQHLREVFSRKVLKTLGLILAWYVLSTGLSLYNKQLLGTGHGLLGMGQFPAPLLMTSVQFACQMLLARLVFYLGLVERTISNRRMAWSDYLRLVVPNGVITGLDIGFSNTSLAFINLSFYTMCKSTVPIFLLFFAFVWGIERPSWELLTVVGVIAAGLALLVRGEAQFQLLGFGLVMTASCLSGLRFTLMQVLLHGHHTSAALGGPLEVLELLTPVMSVTVLLFSLAWEELWRVLPGSPYFSGAGVCALTGLVVAAGAGIAFLMVWTEYQVIKETSALTFMIAGTVKEVVTVLAAVVVLGDQLTPVNGLGLAVVIAGVLLFNYYKYRKLKQAQDGPSYAALEAAAAAKDDDADTSETGGGDDDGVESGGKAPHRRHHVVGALGGGGGGSSGQGPVSAAAVAALSAEAAAGAGHSGSGSQQQQQGPPGLLARVLAGLAGPPRSSSSNGNYSLIA
ncbi:hypothetical protein Agub_g14358, partial [Astrephomene gubernaculifera]